MKKTLLTILLGTFGMVILVAPALATTSVYFAPANVSVSQGQTFTLTIGVNPQGVKNYTVKTELHYPANLLEVKSFTFANSWMPLAQSGYDLIDNTNGVLKKTAGYPGGLSSATTFGTVSFFAKKSGNGTVVLDSGSFALDANNQNALSGTSIVSFSVTEPASVPAQPTAVTSPSESEEPEVTGTTTSELQEDSQLELQTPFLAAIGGTLTLGTGNIWLGVLVGLLILVVIVYAIYSFIRERRRKLK